MNLNEKLEYLSVTDSLTDILNRRGFTDQGEKQWANARREKQTISALMIDIDHFKQYNDNYGHINGDECLKKVAKAIEKALFRPLDIIARTGGEEFAALLSDTDEHSAKTVAKRVLESVQTLELEHSLSTVSDFVTISIGVATCTNSTACNLTDLLDVADGALYESKQNGRNRITSTLVKPRKSIFVVDDDFEILSLFREVLGKEWEVFTFSKSTECVARTKEIVPDLMLVDIMMNDLDGYEVTQQIRNNAATKDVPIIFVSSLEKSLLLSKAKEYGANSFIKKPINIEKLYNKVESFL